MNMRFVNRYRTAFLLLFAVELLSARQGLRFEIPSTAGARWFKGNTHTHTTNSDGDTAPDTVARWYKSHGYQFLVLSDHNAFTDPKTLASLNDSNFLLIAGEELTSSFAKKPVHVNGLNIPGLLETQKDSTLLGTIQKNVDKVRSVQGVPHINHPNFGWAIDHETLRRVRNDRLLEIYNAHPLVHNHGGGGKPSVESVWDTLLTGGMKIFGIAVDDAHNFKGEFDQSRSNPGRAWICVKAKTLVANELMSNLEAGLFYASTGVVLNDVVVNATTLTVEVKQQSDFRYTIEFIGDGGAVLKRVDGARGEYTLSTPVSYVRARVKDSGGAVAWIQPVFVEKDKQ
jgi:hypothetical protein